MSNSTLRISLVEDDPAVCQHYLESVNDFPNLEIVSISHTAEEANMSIPKDRCHVVILNMDLGGEGEKVGLEILKKLHGKLTPIPFIYILNQ